MPLCLFIIFVTLSSSVRLWNWFSSRGVHIPVSISNSHGNKVHKFIASWTSVTLMARSSIFFRLLLTWQQGNEIRKSDTECMHRMHRTVNGCCRPQCNSIIKCFQHCNWINGFALIFLSLAYISHTRRSTVYILMAIICSMFTMCTLKWIKMQYHA